MLLVAVDNNAAPVKGGIYVGNEIIRIDLCSSLPSIFLRPHAQHGLVVKRNIHESKMSFDIAANVVGIVRLRIDNVISWIGTGNLPERGNLFPSPAYDFGYEILLQSKDSFENKYHKIAQYKEWPPVTIALQGLWASSFLSTQDNERNLFFDWNQKAGFFFCLNLLTYIKLR